MNASLDTNILTRTVDVGHVMHRPAVDATAALRRRGVTLYLFPQVLYEFWAVATRPRTVNGLDMTVAAATAELVTIRARFTVLPDTPAIYPVWEALVTRHAVVGKTAHDARLAAAMAVHGVTHLLTFNDADFRRFPGLTVLTPAAVLAPPVP